MARPLPPILRAVWPAAAEPSAAAAEAIARAVRDMVMAGTDGILVIAPFRDQVAEIRTAILRA